jgi:menaquinone-dependent protoporphyrinogen IX oxidase
MNIGIIVFSRTGNTLNAAERIREAIIANGHVATIERIHAENEEPNNRQPLRLTVTPDPTRYDAVIFGAAVEAFSLSSVLSAYLSQMPEMGKKKAGCFVTQHLAKPWMGGNRAIRQMRALCQKKGLDVRAKGIVNWTNKAREAQIAAIAAEFAKL